MAYWIWFPHDFEIDLRGKVEMRRQEHGMTCPSIWRMDAPGRSIAFHKRYHLDKPGRTRMASQGGAYVMLDGAAAFRCAKPNTSRPKSTNPSAATLAASRWRVGSA